MLLFNRNNVSENITVFWHDLGLDAATPMHVRDLWKHKTIGIENMSYRAEVPAHGCVLLKLTPAVDAGDGTVHAPHSEKLVSDSPSTLGKIGKRGAIGGSAASASIKIPVVGDAIDDEHNSTGVEFT